MRGSQSVDEYLEKLMAKDRWAEIYKELVAQDEEYQQMVRDYLNDFHLHENDDEEPDADDADTFGDYLFQEDPLQIRDALVDRNKQKFLDILEDLEIVPLHALDATLKAYFNGSIGKSSCDDYIALVKCDMNEREDLKKAYD